MILIAGVNLKLLDKVFDLISFYRVIFLSCSLFTFRSEVIH
jgi:hypothetical protein